MFDTLKSKISGFLNILNAADPMNPRFWTSEGNGPWSSSTSSGQLVNDESAMRESTIFSCIRLLSENVAQLPKNAMHIVNGEKEKNIRNPLYTVMAYSPVTYMSSFDYWKWNMVCLLLRGFYLSEVFTRDSDGLVTGLLPMHPNYTEIKVRDTGVLYFETIACIDVARGRTSRQYRRTLELGVNAFYGSYATLDGITPISPIKYNAECVGNAIEMREYSGTLFRNNATPAGVLEVTKRLKDDNARLNLEKSWYRKQGGGNRGGISVLEEGTTFKPISMSAEDSQYLQTRRYTKEEICGVYGVPPHLIGDTSQAKGWSTVEQQNSAFVTLDLSPLLVRIEQSITLCLIPRREWNKQYVNIDEKKLLRADLKTMTDYWSKAIQYNWLNPDEVRDAQELNPREDGKGGEYWPPQGITKEENENDDNEGSEDENNEDDK